LLLTGNLHYIGTAYWQLALKCYILLATDFEFLQFVTTYILQATDIKFLHFTGNWH